MEIDFSRDSSLEQVVNSNLEEKQMLAPELARDHHRLAPAAQCDKAGKTENSLSATKKILDRINTLMAEKDLVLVTKTKDELLDSTLIYFSLIKIRVNIIYKPVYKLCDGKLSVAGVKDWDQLRCFLGRLAILISKYPQTALDSLKDKNIIICQHAFGSSTDLTHPEMHVFQLNQYENLEIHLYEFVLNSNGNNLSLCN